MAANAAALKPVSPESDFRQVETVTVGT